MAHYLAEKHDPSFLGPKDPESHATLLRWELFVLLNLDRHLSAHALRAWGIPVEDDVLKKADVALARFLPTLEAWFKEHAYVAGDAFTVGDIVTRTSFMYAEMAKLDLSSYPSIEAWMKRCADRPAFIKAKG